ncbi:unnamed protein product [Musa hybrid cultivar]
MAYFPLLALLALSSLLRSATPAPAGLQLGLTHVDAGSPFTFTERVRRAAQRSRHRREVLEARLANSSGDIQVPITSSKFEYKLEFAIGTPELNVTAILDTGSELVWTQCRPCDPCVQQSTPVYDPSDSSSFSRLPCTSPLYDYQVFKRFDPPTCHYAYGYGSGATQGVLAMETFTFGTKSVSNITFGCSRQSKGNFAGTSGIVGFGRGNLSLISQLGFRKFSYCLTSFNSSSSSHLRLGSLATLNGTASKVQSTPFLDDTNLYRVSLRGISLGEALLPIPNATFEYRRGELSGTVIDSGTGQTQLPKPVYEIVKQNIKSLVGLPVVDLSSTIGLDLCFSVSSWPPPPVPDMTFHFDNADMTIPPANYMYPDQNAGAFCLVMQRSESNLTIVANYQQQNMHVVYDVAGRTLSFMPARCEDL